MALAERELAPVRADKEELRWMIEKQNKRSGFVPDSDVTIEQMQASVAASLRAAGIRPEDNDASRAIIAAREEKGNR